MSPLNVRLPAFVLEHANATYVNFLRVDSSGPNASRKSSRCRPIAIETRHCPLMATLLVLLSLFSLPPCAFDVTYRPQGSSHLLRPPVDSLWQSTSRGKPTPRGEQQ